MTRRPRYSTYDDRKRLQFFSWFQRLRIILLVDWLIEDLMLHSRSRVQAVCIDPYMHGAAHWRPSQRKHEDKDLACKQTPDAVHSDLQTTAKDKASVHWQLRTHTHTHTYISSTPCENSIPLTLCWLEVAVYSFSGGKVAVMPRSLCYE